MRSLSRSYPQIHESIHEYPNENEFEKNPKLRECNPVSIIHAETNITLEAIERTGNPQDYSETLEIDLRTDVKRTSRTRTNAATNSKTLRVGMMRNHQSSRMDGSRHRHWKRACRELHDKKWVGLDGGRFACESIEVGSDWL